ncbi:hypothetical protein ACWD7Y_32125 [Streptomyces drozdowiczii]
MTREGQRESGGHWAVTGDDGEVRGRIALRGMEFGDGIAEAAYWVLPAARGCTTTGATTCICTPWSGAGETGASGYRAASARRRRT